MTPEELAAIKQRAHAARLLRGMTMMHYRSACDDREALLARVEELEAALREIDGLWDVYGHSHNSPYERDVNTIARRALGGGS